MRVPFRDLPRGPVWLGFDQLLSMGSNLVVTVGLVRRGGESQLGAFAAVLAAYTIYLVLQRALLSEPATASRRSEAGGDPALGASSLLVLAVSVPVALAIACVAVAGVPALLPLAVCLPFLALQDNTRYMSSRAGRPYVAATMDGLWLVSLSALVLALPAASGSALVWMWAVCGSLGLLSGLVLLLRPAVVGQLRFAAASAWWRRECSVVGRATGLDMVLSQVYAQGAVFVVVGAVGFGAAGQYRAAQSLFGGCMATIVALSMYALPRLRRRGSSLRSVAWLASRYFAAVASVGLVTLVLNGPAQQVLFGREVVPWPVAVATLVLFCALSLSSAEAAALRVHAASRLRLLLGARSLMLMVGLPLMLLAGRAGSVALVLAAQAVGVLVFVALTFAGLRARDPKSPGGRAPARRALSPFTVHLAATGVPVVDVAYCAVRGLGPARVTRSTELVIEGFPRSANTYARAAFCDANPSVRVTSHLHNARSVLRAVHLGIPVVVLVRDPLDAVSSLLVRDERVHPKSALHAYLHFYQCVLPFSDHVVVADFPQVTADFGAVVEQVDSMFGRSFARYVHDDAAEERVRSEVERMERAFAGGVLDERAVARPSAERTAQAEKVRSMLLEGQYARLLVDCRSVHDRLVAQIGAVNSR